MHIAVLALLIGQIFTIDLRAFELPAIGSYECPGTEAADPPPAEAVVGEDYVELRRSNCYGSCPAYTLRVQADGKVQWQGRSFVQTIGDDTAAIAPEKARALLEKFRSSRVWSLCGEYSRAVTDSVTYTTTIRIGTREKRISEYAETAPEWFHDLEDEVDIVAEARHWIDRDPKMDLFEFVSKREVNTPEPLTGVLPITDPAQALRHRKRLTPLMRASAGGDRAMVESLIGQMADVNAEDEGGWTALMYATGNSGTDIIRMLLDAGADPNARTGMGQTPAMAAVANSENSMEKLSLILQSGGDINAQDKNGQTALMFAANHAASFSRPYYLARAELLTFMRLSGARADLRDKNGISVFDELEQEASLLVNSGPQYGEVMRIIRDVVPGDYLPIKVSGRVARPSASALTITGVRLDRVGTGISTKESSLADDGTFEFRNVPQGVYTLHLIPSTSVRQSEITISVTNSDVSNVRIAAPVVRELFVAVELLDNAPSPPVGIVFEYMLDGNTMGLVPEPRDGAHYVLPAGILAAIAADGKATDLQIVRLGGASSDDLGLRVYLPDPFDEKPVEEAEQLPNGLFRITLPEGKYQVAAVVPYPGPPVSVKSLTRGAADLLTNRLTISGQDQDPIHVKLEKGRATVP